MHMVTYVLSAEAFATGIQICDQEISFFIYRDSLDKNVISIVDPLILSLGVNSFEIAWFYFDLGRNHFDRWHMIDYPLECNRSTKTQLRSMSNYRSLMVQDPQSIVTPVHMHTRVWPPPQHPSTIHTPTQLFTDTYARRYRIRIRTYKLIHVELKSHIGPVHANHPFNAEVMIVCRILDIKRFFVGQVSVVAFEKCFPISIAQNREGSFSITLERTPSFGHFSPWRCHCGGWGSQYIFLREGITGDGTRDPGRPRSASSAADHTHRPWIWLRTSALTSHNLRVICTWKLLSAKA